MILISMQSSCVLARRNRTGSRPAPGFSAPDHVHFSRPISNQAHGIVGRVPVQMDNVGFSGTDDKTLNQYIYYSQLGWNMHQNCRFGVQYRSRYGRSIIRSRATTPGTERQFIIWEAVIHCDEPQDDGLVVICRPRYEAAHSPRPNTRRFASGSITAVWPFCVGFR